MTRIKFISATLVLTAGLMISNAAQSAITLDTTGIDAQGALTLSTVAMGQLSLVNVTVTAAPGSTTTLISTTPTVDPDSGLTFDVLSFNLPVTKASIKIGWDLKITPISGEAMRSALLLTRPGGRGQPLKRAAVANLRIDYANLLLRADVITEAGTTSNVRLFTFVDNKDTKVSVAGFKLVMTLSLKDLLFDAAAVDKISDALAVAPVLRTPLKEALWGTVAVRADLTSKRPGGKISGTPVTAAELGL